MHHTVKHIYPETFLTEFQTYNTGHHLPERVSMARKKSLPEHLTAFANRLAQFRKASGHSQYSLAREMGVTQRIIAHYERGKGNPPLYLFSKFAKALGVTTDQLLGLEKVTVTNRPRDTGLWRRFTQVEKLSPQARRQVTQYLDTVLKAWKDETPKG
jgi:transcriptional regulator with XRE-family HTH domain